MTAPKAPLLRAPPFPGVDATVSFPADGTVSPELSPETIDRVFAAIREARVGACFWAAPVGQADATTIIRARAGDIAPVLETLERDARTAALWLLPEAVARGAGIASQVGGGAISSADVDPWSLLEEQVTLYAHGDDEWLALAVIAGCAVRVLSPGRFGAPGMDPAGLRRQVADDLAGARYRNPFDDRDANLEETIALLGDWRRTIDANRGIVAACGFSWWKRREIAQFLWAPGHALRFFRSERRAIAYTARHGGALAIWPSRVSATITAAAQARGVALVRVEDGFVRSVGLGSNLVPPSSVTVDRRGIHYDPDRASDLEALLAVDDFAPTLLARAERLREAIVQAGISKYGSGAAGAVPARAAGRRLVLVPGQVEDDMSVLHGGGGLTSNLELLRRTRALEPGAEIWFRPHPDVDAGHRNGAVRDADALLHADRIVRGGGMAGLLAVVDAVHVLTSLTGFEALLRGRDVTCHGTPFYAGWGLTRDLAPVPERRGRQLTLAALIVGVLIVYPRYLDPVTGLPCPPEVLIGRMRDGAARNRLGWVTRVRRLQGRLLRRPR